jgi:hypothetical protein
MLSAVGHGINDDGQDYSSITITITITVIQL